MVGTFEIEKLTENDYLPEKGGLSFICRKYEETFQLISSMKRGQYLEDGVIKLRLNAIKYEEFEVKHIAPNMIVYAIKEQESDYHEKV